MYNVESPKPTCSCCMSMCPHLQARTAPLPQRCGMGVPCVLPCEPCPGVMAATQHCCATCPCLCAPASAETLELDHSRYCGYVCSIVRVHVSHPLMCMCPAPRCPLVAPSSATGEVLVRMQWEGPAPTVPVSTCTRTPMVNTARPYAVLDCHLHASAFFTAPPDPALPPSPAHCRRLPYVCRHSAPCGLLAPACAAPVAHVFPVHSLWGHCATLLSTLTLTPHRLQQLIHLSAVPPVPG